MIRALLILVAPAAGGGNGQVWVNTESHVYHKEGSRFYGKPKAKKPWRAALPP